MRITILALGSRGDILPILPLGQGLQAAGHQVRVVTFADYAGWVTNAGLTAHPIRGDAQALLRTAAASGLMRRRSPLLAIPALLRSYGTLARTLPEDLSDPALRETDLVLNQLPGNLFGPDLAEGLSVPEAVLSVIPLTATRARPLFGFPAWPRFLFPAYNRLTYWLGQQIAWQMFHTAINRWRIKTLGLPERSWWGYDRSPLRDPAKEPYPVICGFSPLVAPPAPDWGQNVSVTGWWLPEDRTWQPSEALIRFLENGPAPVFIGFGSMPLRDPLPVTTRIIEAVWKVNQRAILLSGWAGLGGKLPEEVFALDYAPYDWLFPRMAGILHHGGSGTTGFALHSGTPSCVIPFAFDQFYWGERSAALSVGPAPLPFRRLTTDRLALLLDKLTSNSIYQQQAYALSLALEREAGVAKAVRVIESLC